LVQEFFQNEKFVRDLDQNAKAHEDTVATLLSSIQDDAMFQKLSCPHYKAVQNPPTDEPSNSTVTPSHPIPLPTLIPRLRTRKQLNQHRHVAKVEKGRYDELYGAGVGKGLHSLKRFQVIADQIIEELKQKDPQKHAEYEKYVADFNAGRVSEEMTEE